MSFAPELRSRAHLHLAVVDPFAFCPLNFAQGGWSTPAWRIDWWTLSQFELCDKGMVGMATAARFSCFGLGCSARVVFSGGEETWQAVCDFLL